MTDQTPNDDYIRPVRGVARTHPGARRPPLMVLGAKLGNWNDRANGGDTRTTRRRPRTWAVIDRVAGRLWAGRRPRECSCAADVAVIRKMMEDEAAEKLATARLSHQLDEALSSASSTVTKLTGRWSA